MSKWTKKDIKILKQAIDSFWLYNRPLSDSHRERQAALEAVKEHLAVHRVEIICDHIAQLAGLYRERAQKNQEAADHFAAHPEINGKSTPEMIERFSRFAAEELKGVKAAQILISKIQTLGLPPEVLSYEPR
jgi:hypothetical protein